MYDKSHINTDTFRWTVNPEEFLGRTAMAIMTSRLGNNIVKYIYILSFRVNVSVTYETKTSYNGAAVFSLMKKKTFLFLDIT